MIKFGTSGWRGIIADDFTFDNVKDDIIELLENIIHKMK